MDKLLGLVADHLTEELLGITISGKRHAEIADKIKIRPVKLKGGLYFQSAVSDGKKEFHTNYRREELLVQIESWMRKDYKQLVLDAETISVQALVSKKGAANIHTRKMMRSVTPVKQGHNRTKNYILREGEPVPFLVDLGVMTKEGKVVNARYHKFKQINRFLEFVADTLPALPQDQKLTILDFGCGRSYLTFAIYHYLHVLNGYDVQMIGLDLKEDVIEECNHLAKKYGYEDLHFLTGDIASYTGTEQADMVVTLHACDTATDYALAKAVDWNAKVILSVPCCQHELNGQIRSEVLQPVLKYGLVKERMAALLTDAFRANLLEEQGYQVQLLEFIEMEHTPKNILIRAVKKKNAKPQHSEAFEECRKLVNADPMLAKLLDGRTE